MTRQAELLNIVDTLPPQYFGEVINFAGYLQQKARQEVMERGLGLGTGSRIDPAEAVKRCSGIFKRLDIPLSSDDFLAMRQQERALEKRLDEGAVQGALSHFPGYSPKANSFGVLPSAKTPRINCMEFA